MPRTDGITYPSRMTYDEAKKAIFAEGTVPNGYFGDRTHAGFAFDEESGRTLVVTDVGYYNSGLPIATNQWESLHMLKHHPSARHIKVSRTVTVTA